jgi:hypothetical protein
LKRLKSWIDSKAKSIAVITYTDIKRTFNENADVLANKSAEFEFTIMNGALNLKMKRMRTVKNLESAAHGEAPNHEFEERVDEDDDDSRFSHLGNNNSEED